MTIIAQSQQQTGQLKFPAGFVWGSATASYQIEGAIHEDGRGPSIWDTFSATPGKVLNSDNGAVACDHYHRWPEDIALMQQLNLTGYRFSVAWPRILPQGRGQVNQAGLDFYDRLTDGLLEAGIQPCVTLYHWDLPQTLEDQGGWANRDTAYAFAEYSDIITRHLGDRITNYITINEPWCVAVLGYLQGEHAPGWHDLRLSSAAIHHVLLAHGLAVPILRRNAPRAEVGITLNLWPSYPASNSQADLEAAQLSYDRNNRLFLDPLFKGHYSQAYLDTLPPGLALLIKPGDLELIQAPLDFLGINYYHRKVIQADPTQPAGHEIKPTESLYTAMDWEIYPKGLHDLLLQIHRDYQVPRYYITENGAATDDTLTTEGLVHDRLRLYYLQEHLHQAQLAIEEGVPLAGYFAWSLLDNFEWAWGYSRRFGIVHVDFETQQRTIKDSGYWYSRVARDNALPPERINF